MTRRSVAAKALVEQPRQPAPQASPGPSGQSGSPGRQQEIRPSASSWLPMALGSHHRPEPGPKAARRAAVTAARCPAGSGSMEAAIAAWQAYGNSGGGLACKQGRGSLSRAGAGECVEFGE